MILSTSCGGEWLAHLEVCPQFRGDWPEKDIRWNTGVILPLDWPSLCSLQPLAFPNSWQVPSVHMPFSFALVSARRAVNEVRADSFLLEAEFLAGVTEAQFICAPLVSNHARATWIFWTWSPWEAQTSVALPRHITTLERQQQPCIVSRAISNPNGETQASRGQNWNRRVHTEVSFREEDCTCMGCARLWSLGKFFGL